MNVYDLYAKISLDKKEYDNGLNEASEKISKLGSTIKSGLKVATTATVGAIGAASTAVGALVTSSVKSYASYEQLVGGVETLFKDSANIVQEYADIAYKTAGLSANEYMETVTSFSASLLQSLDGDTASAAKTANQAIIDMADNANKMGTAMESIQNAYQGFAKQNYTMLDNLKLGYGGTKTEMERLVADAEKLDSTFRASRDENGDLTLSYADVVNAIHIIQDEMGITGTTALEADKTVSGSAGSMKAAWKNLMVELAKDNGNIEKSINELVNAAVGTFDNILPVVERALDGTSNLINTLLPKIVNRIPALISKVLPQLLTAGANLINSLVNGIVANLPMLVETALQIIMQLANGIAQYLPTLIPTIVDVILQVVDTLIDNLDMLLEASFAIIVGLAQGLIQALPQLIAKLPEIITSIIDFIIGNIPLIIDTAIQIVMALVNALPQIISALIEAIPLIITGIINALLNNIPLLVEAGINLFIALIQALPEIIIAIVEAIPQIITGIVEAFKNAWPQIKETGKKLLTVIIEGLTNIGNSIKEGVGKVWEAIKNTFSEKIEGAKQWGKDLIENFVSGIKDKIAKVKEVVTNVANTVKDFLGFSEPDEGPLSNFHTYAPDMMKLFAQGIKDNEGIITDQIDKSFDWGSRTIKSAENVSSVGSAESRLDLTSAIKEALDGFEIDWNGKNLGRLIQKYA